jgi:hypothetical protein
MALLQISLKPLETHLLAQTNMTKATFIKHKINSIIHGSNPWQKEQSINEEILFRIFI